jgi:hypothetical protein
MEASAQRHAAAVYAKERTLAPLDQEVEWDAELVWTFRRQISCPYQESNPWSFNPYPNHYTDSAFLALSFDHIQRDFCGRPSGSPTWRSTQPDIVKSKEMHIVLRSLFHTVEPKWIKLVTRNALTRYILSTLSYTSTPLNQDREKCLQNWSYHHSRSSKASGVYLEYNVTVLHFPHLI